MASAYAERVCGWKMTNQEVFNKVVTGLRAQGKPSVVMNTHGSNTCVYRNPDGLKCAVGMLIPDKQYISYLDNGDISLSEVIEAVPALQDIDSGLLSILQRTHDNASDNYELNGFMTDLESGFQRVAKIYNLTLPARVI